MNKLKTVQTKEVLNSICPLGEIGPGGAYHEYMIVPNCKNSTDGNSIVNIKFQKGPRFSENSIHGIIDSDLLEIVKHRLECFQKGEYKCEYNEKALTHIKLALTYMNQRVEDRISRNVLGTESK